MRLDYKTQADINCPACVFWRAHRESNPKLSLRRASLYPFNYEHISYFICQYESDFLSYFIPEFIPVFRLTTIYSGRLPSKSQHIVVLGG